MKYKGQKVTEINTTYTVIPRNVGPDFVFKAQAVLDLEEFDKLFPPPKPPVKFLPGGTREVNTQDPEFAAKMETWSEAKANWMYWKSLQDNPDLEWETIDPQDYTTFKNWVAELTEAKFSMAEITRIMEGIHDACGLNQSRIDEAQDDFLAGLLLERSEPTFQPTEKLNTQSGEPANDGGSSQKG